MSVRKVYKVIVDTVTVFSGSYAACMSVYQSFLQFKALSTSCSFSDVVIAFKPVFSGDDEEGGFFDE